MSARHRPRPMPSALVRAAGALVWRFRDGTDGDNLALGQVIDPDDIEVLIVHRPRYNDWSWPKGKTENGELLTAAAVREVEEETGEIIRLGLPLTVQRYRLGNGHIKEVHYWVGRLVGDCPAARVRVPVHRAPRKEIDDSRWVGAGEAERLLTRRGDRRLLTELLALAANGILITEPLLLMRHAQAVDRATWSGALEQRHLSREGVSQSFDAVNVLSAFGVREVYSSAWMSAHRTVAPYAAAAGLRIHVHEEMGEFAVERDPVAAQSLLRSVLMSIEAPTVMSVHRVALPHLVDTLRGQSVAEARTQYPTDEPWLRSAELLIAHVGVCSAPSGEGACADSAVGQRRVLAVERHAIPLPMPRVP